MRRAGSVTPHHHPPASPPWLFHLFQPLPCPPMQRVSGGEGTWRRLEKKKKTEICSCVFVLCSSTDSSGEIKTFGSQVTRSRIASLPAEPLQRWAAGADTTHWDLAPACPCLRSRWLPRFNAGMLYPPLLSPPRPPPPC